MTEYNFLSNSIQYTYEIKDLIIVILKINKIHYCLLQMSLDALKITVYLPIL
jgi:hypothetical protein